MNKIHAIFTIFVLFSFSLLSGQSATVKFDDVINEYIIEKVSSSNDILNILVTNSKSSDDPKKFSIGANVSQSTFTNKVISSMKESTSNYFFKISSGLVVNVKKDDFKSRTYEIIKPESKEVLTHLLKDLVVWKDEDFNKFLVDLEKNKPINVIESLNGLVLEKGDDNKGSFEVWR